MFIDLLREVARLAKVLAYAGHNDGSVYKCIDDCYNLGVELETAANDSLKLTLGNVEKTIDINLQLSNKINEEPSDLEFQAAVSRHRLFDQIPERLSNLMGCVYQYRERDDENNYFSDKYIEREDAKFVNTGAWGTPFRDLLENLVCFRDCISQLSNEYADLDWPRLGFYWPHLLYAYLIENTRVYEILNRVIYEFRHGERLGSPGSKESQQWLLNTEQLFYKDPPSFLIPTLTSYVRPDLRSTRRNAYYRMFGMDLNHGTEDNRPYPYDRPEAANKEFVNTFEELLKEVWVGMENVKNTSGSRPIDRGAISDLSTRLQGMLALRRHSGNLSREEFYASATMSWLHLTLLHNSVVVSDLRANAETPDQRLRTIAARVGMPAHAKSYHFFQLADCASVVLYTIEAGICKNNPEWLYDPDAIGGGTELVKAMEAMITHWSLATGRDMKAKGTTGKK